jgi:hypothetical protein
MLVTVRRRFPNTSRQFHEKLRLAECRLTWFQARHDVIQCRQQVLGIFVERGEVLRHGCVYLQQTSYGTVQARQRVTPKTCLGRLSQFQQAIPQEAREMEVRAEGKFLLWVVS